MSGAEKSVECIRGHPDRVRVIGLLGWRRVARFCKAAYNPLIAPKVQLSTMKDTVHAQSEIRGRKRETWAVRKRRMMTGHVTFGSAIAVGSTAVMHFAVAGRAVAPL